MVKSHNSGGCICLQHILSLVGKPPLAAAGLHTHCKLFCFASASLISDHTQTNGQGARGVQHCLKTVECSPSPGKGSTGIFQGKSSPLFPSMGKGVTHQRVDCFKASLVLPLFQSLATYLGHGLGHGGAMAMAAVLVLWVGRRP